MLYEGTSFKGTDAIVQKFMVRGGIEVDWEVRLLLGQNMEYFSQGYRPGKVN